MLQGLYKDPDKYKEVYWSKIPGVYLAESLFEDAKSLRADMGDEAFFVGLRRYFELYGGGVASDAEFKAVMEEAAGVSLDGFFVAWIGE